LTIRRTILTCPKPVSNRDDERPADAGTVDEPGSGDPGSRGGADPSSDLVAELRTAREEASQYKDRWVRERADLENLKKRAARDRQDAVRYGAEHLVRDLLPVVDDLERALAAARDVSGSEPVVAGVELVLQSLMDVLARHGVARVAAAGERFDPSLHEAVSHVPHREVPEGMVVEEHRGGYRLHDRLVRAAMVTVSKGDPSADLANPQDGD
jgi:molecular chaperone GrpE